MKTNTSVPRSKNRRNILIAVAVLLVVLGAGFGLYRLNKNDSAPTSKTPNPATEPINYDGPTEQEKTQNDQHKDDLVKEQNQGPTGSTVASPVIGSYGQNPRSKDVEVGAYVQGVYEAGGTCTLTLTNGSASVSSTRTASKGATTTECGVMVIERSRLGTGTWSAKVAYASSTSSGVSSPVNIEVQ
jgi:hypothetical protein